MINTRLIRPIRIRSLISDINHLLLWESRRNYLTIRHFYQTVRDYGSYSLSVGSLLKNCIRSYTTESGLKCWSCNKEIKVTDFSCLHCGVLQKPNPEMTYFQLMNLPENFDLDSDDISLKYKKLQKVFHPDKYVQKSKEEIDISDNYSRLVNKAYSTLKNPLSRGMYMLKLRGIPTDDDSVKIDQEFLRDILEKNEEVENLNDPKALQEFQKSNSEVILECVTMASKAFQRGNLQEALEVLMKMKYFLNIENELKKKKSIMGIVD